MKTEMRVGDRILLNANSKCHVAKATIPQVRAYCGKTTEARIWISEDVTVVDEGWCRVCKKRWLDNPWGKT